MESQEKEHQHSDTERIRMDYMDLHYELNEEIRRNDNADALAYHITQEELEMDGGDGQTSLWTLTIIEQERDWQEASDVLGIRIQNLDS